MNVLITRLIPQIGIELLKAHHKVDLNPEQKTLSREELKQRIQDADAVLCLLTDRIDKEIIDAAPRLKIISNHAVGYDNVDVEYATRRGIAVTNTPGVLTDATADFTWALLMAVCRRIPEGERMMRAGAYPGWDPLMLLGGDIKGKTLGIIGAGRIGSAVAERSRGWQMPILYCDRHANRELEERFHARRVELEELLREADFVTIHVPLTPETHHLIGAVELRQMKPGAYLINTSRGPVVDEAALAEALRSGQIAGAALDVYEHEPAVEPELVAMDQVVLAPHIASATVSTRNKMARIAAENIIRIFSGAAPISIVNPEVLESSVSH